MRERKKKGRRNNNSGNIQFRKGYHYVTVSAHYIDDNGKKIYRRKYLGKYKTLEEAEKAVGQYKEENGLDDDNKKLMKDYLSGWIKICRGKKAETTIKNQSDHIKNYIVPYIGDVKLVRLNSVDINSMTSHLLVDKKLSRNTVIAVINTLNAFLNYAINVGYIIANPIKKAQKIKPSPRLKYIPNNYEEIDLIMNEISSVKDYKISLLFCALCGLRRGEALAVKWEDINFAEKTLKISRQTIRTSNGRHYEKELKTEKSQRVVGLPGLIIEELEKTPKNERKGFIVKITKRKPNCFYYRFVKIREKLGLDDRTTLHSLRHIFATLLLRKGFTIDSVSKSLGHSSIKTTGDIYAHEIAEEQNKQADFLDNYIRRAIANNNQQLL